MTKYLHSADPATHPYHHAEISFATTFKENDPYSQRADCLQDKCLGYKLMIEWLISSQLQFTWSNMKNSFETMGFAPCFKIVLPKPL